MSAGAFRALVATGWAGIGKRAVADSLICRFYIAFAIGRG
jgi:hypothetical protein